jgi:hypothetical protein
MTAPVSPDLHVLSREDGRKVYHLGSLGPLPKDTDMDKAFHLGPYTDGAISVPGHWWNAQVTDRTDSPIVIRKSPAQIVAARRMFPYGDTGCKVLGPSKRVPFTDMGSSDITKYMPTTGGRGDIGLISANSAYYMLGGDPAPMIDWAQSAGSCPMHFRDEATGLPIDLLKYPIANANDMAGLAGSPWLTKGPRNPAAPVYSAWGGGWAPQQAHYYEMSYIAYNATLDLGFLEDLQYSANFTVLCDAAKSAWAGKAIPSGEYRGLAWAFRNLFMAHIATKDTEARFTVEGKPWPSWLHPSSYFKILLDNTLAYYSAFMSKPANQVFRLIWDLNGFPPWEVDFMLTALAFGVLTGHEDWKPLYLWCLKNAVDRTSGKSGYPVGWGCAYYMHSDAPDWYSSWLKMAPDWTADSVPPSQAQIDALKIDPFNGGKAMTGNEPLMTTRAVLVQALYLEKIGLLPDLRATYSDIDTCFTNVDRMVRNYGQMNPNVSIVLDASGVPDTIPPLPTPKPTTQGNIAMSVPALNAPFTATVHFLDDAEVERPVDSIDWSATGAAHLDNGTGHGSTATGIYAGTGPFEIEAIGHVAGAPDISVKVGGTVPVPFPTHGRIDLS